MKNDRPPASFVNNKADKKQGIYFAWPCFAWQVRTASFVIYILVAVNWLDFGGLWPLQAPPPKCSPGISVCLVVRGGVKLLTFANQVANEV